jgi:hypothetical protein
MLVARRHGPRRDATVDIDRLDIALANEAHDAIETKVPAPLVHPANVRTGHRGVERSVQAESATLTKELRLFDLGEPP